MKTELSEKEVAAKREREAALAYAKEVKAKREAEKKKKEAELDAKIAKALEEVSSIYFLDHRDVPTFSYSDALQEERLKKNEELARIAKEKEVQAKKEQEEKARKEEVRQGFARRAAVEHVGMREGREGLRPRRPSL